MDLRKLFGGSRKPRRDDRVEADLREAGEWLDASNLDNARAWALGEERKFEVDQGTGRLTLLFLDGKRAVLPAQIIASFLPGEGSVRWAWANESVDPALAAAATGLKRYGETRGLAELARPEPSLVFDDIVKYAALAASRFGCKGLYRCLRHDHSTVLVGFGSPEIASKEGRPLAVDTLWPKGRASEDFQAAARALVEAWDAEMYPIDRDYCRLADEDRDSGPDAMDAALDAKLAVYRRYWRPRNGAWRPDSFAWPSDHDPAPCLPTRTLPRRGGGCFVLCWPSPHHNFAYVVEDKEGEMRITDIDLRWGDALVWIAPAA